MSTEGKAKFHIAVFLLLFIIPAYVGRNEGTGLFMWLTALIPYVYLYAALDKLE